MEIMLDKKCEFILEKRLEFPDVVINQLRTPLTSYKSNGIPYILDNGAFSNFNEKKFTRMVNKSKEDQYCKFIVMPDVVGKAKKTLEQFYYFKDRYNIESSKCAFVLQDGAHKNLLPKWDEFQCLFIGGSTKFKMSNIAFQLSKIAKKNGLWVHVGRVNTPNRINKWFNFCDSIDGSGISRFDNMLEKAVKAIIQNKRYPQKSIFEF